MQISFLYVIISTTYKNTGNSSMKNCCFTGHRAISDNNLSLHIELEAVLCRLIENGVTYFYAGGAIGWDTLCCLTLCILRKRYPDITLNLILPCAAEQQCLKWSEQQKRQFFTILSHADNVEYIGEQYYNGCMKARNQRLVDNADICVCYYNTKNFRSGTGQTVRMAERKNIRIINLWK